MPVLPSKRTQDSLPSHLKATYIGKIQTKAKVVIGIDFGTAYSGVSIVYPDNPEDVRCSAPALQANRRDQVKVPTVLLKTPKGWFFGEEAWNQYKSLMSEVDDETSEASETKREASEILGDRDIHLFLNFKMQLKDKTSGTDKLQAKARNSSYRHNLLDLITRCLKTLSDFALAEVRSGFLAGHDFSQDDIRWVVTVPAIWNEFGKAFMRKAAWKAGMIDNEASDALVLALEPESAALAVFGEGSSHGTFNEGSCFMVLDCGGGTVDIKCLSVATVEPLVLDEVSPPVGDSWGGIFVEYSFRDFLSRLFGYQNFQKLKLHCPTDIVEIMDNFRKVKEQFDPSTNHENRICLRSITHQEVSSRLELPSLMEMVEAYNQSVEPRLQFDTSNKQFLKKLRRQSVLSLTKDQMLSFFEKSLTPMCQCVNGLLQTNPEISTIVVVGGYGGNKVLQSRVRDEFPDKIVIVPDRSTLVPQAAVVQGAAIYGLYTSVIGVRILKNTYGFSCNSLWYEGCGFRESESEYDRVLSQKRVPHVFKKLAKRGTKVKPAECFRRTGYSPLYPTQSSVSFPIYSHHPRKSADGKDSIPKLVTADGCTLIGRVEVPCRHRDDNFDVEFTFGSELRVEVVRDDGDRYFETIKIE